MSVHPVVTLWKSRRPVVDARGPHGRAMSTLIVPPPTDGDARRPPPVPRVAAHRGACGYRPEHTLGAYRTAIRMGADDIEVDLVATADGVLVARHENELSRTTDIASVPDLAGRRRVGSVDGRTLRGWFTEDLTLEELKRLGARERKARLRVTNTLHDGREGVPTLDEVLALAAAEGVRRGREVGVLLELKNPSHFAARGLDLLDPLLAALRRHGHDRPDSSVTVMAFETGVLRDLAARASVPRVQLLGAAHRTPWDLRAGDGTRPGAGRRRRPRTYGELAGRTGLAWIREYAQGVGPTKELVLPVTDDGHHGAPTPVVRQAHALGLGVQVWTLRAENRFLPPALRSAGDDAEHGDLGAEVTAFLRAGVDRVITDHPDLAVAARDAFAAAPTEHRGEEAG